jgi:hypothetical protein
MRTNQRLCLCLGISILGMLIVSPWLMGQTLMEQAVPKSEAALPAVSDWSQHHLIFSKPATAKQARVLAREPRYQQQLRRQLAARLPEAGSSALSPEVTSRIELSRRVRNRGTGGLWSEYLGSGASVGAVNYPAKAQFRTSMVSCANDFVVYGTGLTGASGAQASIVAFSNLYSGCGGTVPSAYWAYNTNGGTVTTSPVISSDFSQIAFTQADGSGHGNLVLLKWAANDGTVGSPHTLARTRGTSYFTCAAPCMTYFVLRDSSDALQSDSNSSVFYDYSTDTAYVGDDGGSLHKFTPVFDTKNPAEVRTGGWPVQVNPGSPTALTSPVYDGASGNVFVADVGGFLYAVSPGAVVTTSGQLDFSFAEDGGPGIVQGPIVDSTSGLVYVFATSDGSGLCAGGADCSAVYQLLTSFTDGETGLAAVVGNSTVAPAVPSPLYIGVFNSTYENSVNATGDLYVCGNTGAAPTLYQVAIQGGLGTVIAGPVLSTPSTTTPCSPVTDVMNPNAAGSPTEWMFASVRNGGASTGCSSGGCIFNFKDTPWLSRTAYVVGQEVLDSNFHTEFVITPGTSGASAPFWISATGGSTTDGTVHWLDLGPLSAGPPAVWAPLTHFPKGSEILDGNNNIELVTSNGPDLSGVTVPTFNTTPGGTTTDATVTWTNVGAITTAAMAASGGTSGLIIDNIVGSGIEAGASQIYFSTLSDQTCTTSGGTGGCAVQASQSALK